MILHSLHTDCSSRHKLLDAIGARAERLLKRRCGNVALAPIAVGAFPPMLRQDRELANDLRQLPVAWPIEDKFHLAIAVFLGADDMTVISRILWMIFFEGIKRENHVIRSHGLAVMPCGSRMQAVDREGKISRMAHCLGE